MMRAIGDQVEKNPEYLSILDKKAIKDGKIDDETQVEQVSVMNKLLNDALRTKGYKGPDIKMVLTDVTDPNGPYYTDTLTNTVVFDRKKLASANRDEILNALGHEFGHYSKEDDIDKSQDIANHTGKLLEDRTKGMVAKEATEDTLAAIRNNKNVITGEEGKKLADSIPMNRREYDIRSKSISISETYKGETADVSYTKYTSYDYKNQKVEVVIAREISMGGGIPNDIGIGISFGYYPRLNSFDDIPNEAVSIGGSYVFPGMYGISTGTEAVYNKDGVIGRKISFGKSYRDLGVYIKTGVHTEIISKEEYELFDYLKKAYPRGGRNSWR